jgi:hypothetical protein
LGNLSHFLNIIPISPHTCNGLYPL